MLLDASGWCRLSMEAVPAVRHYITILKINTINAIQQYNL
jgi:hypothetical protein